MARIENANIPSPFDELHFRDIGPGVTGGRIHDLQIGARRATLDAPTGTMIAALAKAKADPAAIEKELR